MIEPLISLLVTLIILGLIFGLIFWVINTLIPVPQPFKNAILAIAALIFLLVLIGMLTGGVHLWRIT